MLRQRFTQAMWLVVPVFCLTVCLLFFYPLAIGSSIAKSGLQDKGSNDVDDFSPAAKFRMRSEELYRKKMSGSRGDERAAIEVALHYGSVVQPSRQEQELALYWLMVASENGSIYGQRLLASVLERKGDELSCARAIYWLERVVSHPQRTVPDSGNDEDVIELNRMRAKLVDCVKADSGDRPG